ncbi:MAG: hypothetical protein ACI4I6_09500 [Hominimerdicola sp.]
MANLHIRKLSKESDKKWWKVGDNFIYIPDPNTKYEHTNVADEDSGRDAKGFMNIGWIRRDVRKVYIHYSTMSESELNYMFDLLQGKEFSFTFPDRTSGRAEIKNAYCAQSTYEMYMENYRGTGEAVYSDVSFNIIEK